MTKIEKNSMQASGHPFLMTDFPDTISEREPISGAILSLHFKNFGRDGVGLVRQLYNSSFRKKGLTVFDGCSDLPSEIDGLNIPELSYQSESAREMVERIFHPIKAEKELDLWGELKTQAESIKNQVEDFIKAKNIKILHVHNILSITFHPAATLAIYNLAKENSDIQIVNHIHDLKDENKRRQRMFPLSPYHFIADRLEEAILPKLQNVHHVALSQQAANKIMKDRNLEVQVIPDGYDFDLVKKFDKWDDLEKRFGIRKNDLKVGVSTRITDRKAIEFAIQFVKKLQERRRELENRTGGIGAKNIQFDENSQIILILTNNEDKNDNLEYFKALMRYAKEMGVKIVDISDQVVTDSVADYFSPEMYSFYETYDIFDVFCFSPYQEGFGNNLLEGVGLAKGVIPVVFEYPSFKNLIKRYLPHFISLGDTYNSGVLADNLELLPQKAIDMACEQQIKYLLYKEQAYDFSNKNIASLKEQFDVDIITNRFLSLYRRIEKEYLM